MALWQDGVVVYEDTPRQLISVGESTASGFISHARAEVKARRQIDRDRSTVDTVGASRDLHLAVKPGTDVGAALAIHRYLVNGSPTTRFGHARANAEWLRRAPTSDDDRPRSRGCEPAAPWNGWATLWPSRRLP
jgi:hypothetical protein